MGLRKSMVGWVSREVRHWPLWWSELRTVRKAVPIVFIAAYCGFLWGADALRSEHLTASCAILFLSYGGRGAATLLQFLMPLALTGFVYDTQRFYGELIRGRIRVAEPYLFDRFFFGIATSQGRLTPNEWWQLHTHPILDLLAGFFYLFFIAGFVIIAAVFRFYFANKGTRKLSSETLSARAPAVMWSFFWVNLIGYSTYYWYPAAPPWYVATYGLGPVRLDVPASPAGCARFDELLGISYFSEFYSRSADVFGAIPSLHVAYPFLAAYFAFRFGELRVTGTFFFLGMCFSAVYLNHHYVLDIIWGAAYAAISAVITEWYFLRRSSRVLIGPVGSLELAPEPYPQRSERTRQLS